MTQTVEEELKSLVQWDAFPILTQDEINTLLEGARVIDANGVSPDSYTKWLSSTVYALADVAVPTKRNGLFYVVTTAGTSGVTEPVWGLAGTTVDGTVNWGVGGPIYWTPTYNLNRAASKGWRLKAAKVANRVDQSTDVTTLRISQLFKMCMDMSKAFARGSATSIQVEGATEDNLVPIIGNLND